MPSPVENLRAHPDVYDPGEDSLLLCRAIAARGLYPGAFGLDVGTGSGIAARALLAAGCARVVATDVNPFAVRLARENAPSANIVRCDLFGALKPDVRFDVISFNAPYLPTAEDEHVPGYLDLAFDGGAGGVEIAVRFVRELPRRLAPGGRAFLVLSSRGETQLVADALREQGLSHSLAGQENFFFEEIRVWEIMRSDEN